MRLLVLCADLTVPPWVINATRLYLKEQETGQLNPKRQPLAQPHRCRQIKTDGIRCMLWSTGRPKDDGLCRVHLRSLKNRPTDDLERAREKLTQAAPYAVDKLEEMTVIRFSIFSLLEFIEYIFEFIEDKSWSASSDFFLSSLTRLIA